MGSYLNPGSDLFEMALKSQIFVDKSGLIEKTNRCLRTLQRYMCVSRPRRFGKSMGVDMLAAYYDRSVDTKELFHDLKISSTEGYEKHLNQYDVLKINMQEFLSATSDIESMMRMVSEYLIFDLKEQYTKVRFRDEKNLVQVMKDIYNYTKHPFVILIDEWDCLFREYQQDQEAQKKYLDFLRFWLKDKDYVALASSKLILYFSHSLFTSDSVNPKYSARFPGSVIEYSVNILRAECEPYFFIGRIPVI